MTTAIATWKTAERCKWHFLAIRTNTSGMLAELFVWRRNQFKRKYTVWIYLRSASTSRFTNSPLGFNRFKSKEVVCFFLQLKSSKSPKVFLWLLGNIVHLIYYKKYNSRRKTTNWKHIKLKWKIVCILKHSTIAIVARTKAEWRIWFVATTQKSYFPLSLESTNNGKSLLMGG